MFPRLCFFSPTPTSLYSVAALVSIRFVHRKIPAPLPARARTPGAPQKEASKNFQSIGEAYDVLSDKKKRAIYDQYGYDGLRDGVSAEARLPSPALPRPDPGIPWALSCGSQSRESEVTLPHATVQDPTHS